MHLYSHGNFNLKIIIFCCIFVDYMAALNFKQDQLYFFIDTLKANGFSSTEMHALLVQRWGEDNVISIRRIQQIASEFSEGDRNSHKRKPGSGRPRTSTSTENVEIIRELIEENNRLSCNDLSQLTGIDCDAVNRILTRDLHKKNLCCKWLPHELSEQNKETRVECCRTMIERYSRRRSRETIVVIDEKWVYFKDTPAKENNRAWVDGAGDRPAIARRTISNRKVMIILASNYSKSFYYLEVLHHGTSINSQRYIDFLENMVNEFENLIPRWEMVIQHDNARPHVARIVTEWIETQHISLLKQPPYSPDTNLMDRFLFRNYEVFRRGRDFDNSNEAHENVRQYMDGMTNNKLVKELQNLLTHLQKVIDVNGNYVI